MSAPIIIPAIVSLRWREAHAAPSIARWRSLAQMIAAMVVNSSIYTPDAPIVDDLRILAGVAHNHALDMMRPAEQEQAA